MKNPLVLYLILRYLDSVNMPEHLISMHLVTFITNVISIHTQHVDEMIYLLMWGLVKFNMGIVSYVGVDARKLVWGFPM